MTTAVNRPRGRYGIDAPWVPWMFVGLTVLYLFFLVAGLLTGAEWWVTVLVALATLVFAAAAFTYLYTTYRGKFAVWSQLVGSAPAARTALDLGCGHGTVAILIALRMPGCRVTGIDLWRSIDQSGNTPEAAERNAAENAVADRIEFVTGDMTALPFADAAFDLVTANVAIHNIPSAEGRATAVREAWRVLAPGGTLLIADIRRAGEYQQTLETLGATVSRRGAGPRMWWSGPWMATTIVSAGKPR